MTSMSCAVPAGADEDGRWGLLLFHCSMLSVCLLSGGHPSLRSKLVNSTISDKYY